MLVIADGRHSSPGGREKMAHLLLSFLPPSPTTMLWFLADPSTFGSLDGADLGLLLGAWTG